VTTCTEWLIHLSSTYWTRYGRQRFEACFCDVRGGTWQRYAFHSSKCTSCLDVMFRNWKF